MALSQLRSTAQQTVLSGHSRGSSRASWGIIAPPSPPPVAAADAMAAGASIPRFPGACGVPPLRLCHQAPCISSPGTPRDRPPGCVPMLPRCKPPSRTISLASAASCLQQWPVLTKVWRRAACLEILEIEDPPSANGSRQRERELQLPFSACKCSLDHSECRSPCFRVFFVSFSFFYSPSSSCCLARPLAGTAS